MTSSTGEKVSIRLQAIGGTASVPVDDTPLSSSYDEAEYLLHGLAETYCGPATGPASPTGEQHAYVTRVLVRRPRDPQARSGRVVVEPFNTSNGPDSDVIWARVAPMLQAAGDTWVGVSVRASSATALERQDADRYADVDIPTNDVAWDLLAHVGALLKHGGDHSPMGSSAATHVYLCGYSQSGADTATFAMAFHERARRDDGSPIYDGYFPAAHSGSLTPLASGTSPLPRFETAAIGPVGAPVVDIETQCDVEGFRAQLRSGATHVSAGAASVRRPDGDVPGDRFRLYEIAGAPHADWMPGCDGDGSTFPTSAFLRAALRRLFEWVEDDVVPPRSAPIELAVHDVVSVAAVDSDGNALGGIRSPYVDVPLSRFDVHSTGSALCLLVGHETPLPPSELVRRYADAETYLHQFTRSLDETIALGFLLEDDRAELLAAQTARAKGVFG